MTKEHGKEERTTSIIPPREPEKFIRDVNRAFSLNKNQISFILDELKIRRDSFSTVHAAKSLNTPIDVVNAYATFVQFVVHMMTSHHIELASIEDDLMKIGCEKDKVSLLVSMLRSLDEQTIIGIGKSYWLGIEVSPELHFGEVDSEINYRSLVDDKGNFLGLAPILRLQFELITVRGDKKTFTLHSGLDDLNILIKLLQEIYETAVKDTKTLKQEFEGKIACVPEDG